MQVILQGFLVTIPWCSNLHNATVGLPHNTGLTSVRWNWPSRVKQPCWMLHNNSQGGRTGSRRNSLLWWTTPPLMENAKILPGGEWRTCCWLIFKKKSFESVDMTPNFTILSLKGILQHYMQSYLMHLSLTVSAATEWIPHIMSVRSCQILTVQTERRSYNCALHLTHFN